MFLRNIVLKSIFVIMLYTCTINASAEVSNTHNDLLTDKTKAETIKSLTTLIKQKYATANTATKMSNILNRYVEQGAYDNISNPTIFAEKLTSDIRSIHNDKHLFVIYDPKGAQNLLNRNSHHSSKNYNEKRLEENAWENYGFNAVKILPGNIAYIDYRRFINAADSKNTIASVMQLVSHANALIFDLRGNRGGDPKTVQLLASYLFGNKPVHLNDLYKRSTNETHQSWTLKKIDGIKMPNIPVYILTGPMTFSAAEEFTYDLQSLKRAVVIGNPTAGGAHAAEVLPLNALFVTQLPTSEAINPITKKDWEGTGVIPNVIVPNNQALKTAHILALQTVLRTSNNKIITRKTRWISEMLLASQKAPSLSYEQLQRFVGTYGYHNIISFKNGCLYYKEHNIPENNPIIPISNDKFIYKDINDRLLNLSQIKFKLKKSNQVEGMTILNENGDHEYYPKKDKKSFS